MTVSFEHRVVLVTGAASGLGRECALTTAARGARLILVDRADCQAIAAEVATIGHPPIVLQLDLAEIDAPARAVATAIAAHGRIDAVIAAAGMLRDRSFAKMDMDGEFDPVLRVHLAATARLVHAAWPHMRDAGYGRVLLFSAHAGLFGNFGQANYAAAKMGLVGLALTLALEGARHGIHSNVLAPLAATPMAAGTAIIDDAALLRPASVAAAAAWLCSAACAANGVILAAAGGALARVRISQSEPVVIGDEIAVEDVARMWLMIADAPGEYLPADAAAGLSIMVDAIKAARRGDAA